MMLSFLLALSWFTSLLASPLAGGRQGQEDAIHFQIVNAGLTVDGSLTGLTATGQFDPAHLEQASVRASVPVGTIQTGIVLRDKHLQKPDYFDAEKYPTITMQSIAFRKTGGEQYEGTFTLTMKGISHEVKLPFTVSPTHELQGQFRINRLDYNLGKSSLILANEVLITVKTRLGAS
ncbi:YceI family protein [Hymenobacter cheonanensis]|uniref:YceI family protein n=1 Tax=Hymenobacter sp. CA2-7 TaxID=3063993 RepID=UPI002712B50F|nr:YceI family protein [Hymenobacter sp. CA2-7]MDO7885668.1 YceI family protein [Hymenobacter sp. CA2-7]